MMRIPVTVETVEENGKELPAVLIFDDGTRATISKVLFSSESVDNSYPGIRYTVRIDCHAWFLFHVGKNWFFQTA